MDLHKLDLHAEVTKADRAKELMDQIIPYIDNLRKNYIDSFIGCPAEDVSNIVVIKMKLDLIDSLHKDLEKVIFSGKVASIELQGELDV